MFGSIISTWWDILKMLIGVWIIPAEFVEMIEFQNALDKYSEGKERLLNGISAKNGMVEIPPIDVHDYIYCGYLKKLSDESDLKPLEWHCIMFLLDEDELTENQIISVKQGNAYGLDIPVIVEVLKERKNEFESKINKILK